MGADQDGLNGVAGAGGWIDLGVPCPGFHRYMAVWLPRLGAKSGEQLARSNFGGPAPELTRDCRIADPDGSGEVKRANWPPVMNTMSPDEDLEPRRAVVPVIAAVCLDPAAIQIDGKQVAGGSAGMRTFEQDAAVSQDSGGQVIAWRIRQPERVSSFDQRCLDLKSGGGATRIDDMAAGSVEGSDGVLAKPGKAARRSARERRFPDLPRVARALFTGKENAPAVERDGRVGGGRELRNQGPNASFRGDLDRPTLRKTISAAGLVTGCPGEQKRQVSKGLGGAAAADQCPENQQFQIHYAAIVWHIAAYVHLFHGVRTHALCGILPPLGPLASTSSTFFLDLGRSGILRYY